MKTVQIVAWGRRPALAKEFQRDAVRAVGMALY